MSLSKLKVQWILRNLTMRTGIVQRPGRNPTTNQQFEFDRVAQWQRVRFRVVNYSSRKVLGSNPSSVLSFALWSSSLILFFVAFARVTHLARRVNILLPEVACTAVRSAEAEATV